MPKTINQKLKLLYLLKYLYEHSDSEHPVTADNIIDYLCFHDISIERKTLYSDIESLRLFGYDIQLTKRRPSGYFLVSREFELPELMLLVDSVQSSRFITEKKTFQLISKLEGLCSAYEAQSMHRNIFVSGRIKSMNESIYYSIDGIHRAIIEDRQISFKYYNYSIDKKKVYRHSGKLYKVSPFALIWNSENYYLVAYDEISDKLKHYRVDKMTNISVTGSPRLGKEVFHDHDIASYSDKNFSMFGGEEMYVKLRFSNEIVGVVFDRFGKDIIVNRDGDSHFTVFVKVAVSDQFFGWICGLGSNAEILLPENIRNSMKSFVSGILDMY